MPGRSGPTVETKRGYCRVCMTHCGLVFDIAGDRILRVRGDREHPITQGYTCPKGRASGRLHHHPDAITRPLMRKQGELVTVAWDEALDDVAARLRRIIAVHGENAIGTYFGSGLGLDSAGYAMEEAFCRALGTPPKFSPLTIDGTAKVMVAGAMGGFPGLNPKTDYDRVELLIYVGTNPMVSHAHNTGMHNPARFIRAVAARGEVWTIDPLFTETAKWSTRHVAAYPGKDYAILAWLTRVETGTGITMSAGGNLTQWFAWALMILTGAMNRPGGAWFHPGFLTRLDSFELPVRDGAWTPGPTTRPDVSGIVGDWPCAVLPAEIEAGNIRALMNFSGSIPRSFPDTNALVAALKQLELNVAIEIVANETTALCTHVLPTKGALERPELTRWDTLAWNVSMQYVPALVEPMGERRSAWWVISQIMRRAGLRVPSHVPEDDADPGADERMLARLMRNTRCTFEELKQRRYVEAPLEFPAAWVDAHVARIGGWRLAPQRLLAQWWEMRRADEAAIDRPRPLCYSSRRQRSKFNAQMSFLGEPANVILHPEDAGARGILDGQAVRVHNPSGEITLVAKLDRGMRRGVASIPHGHETANVNHLTSREAIDPLGGMALYSGVSIEVEPIGA